MLFSIQFPPLCPEQFRLLQSGLRVELFYRLFSPQLDPLLYRLF
jgi:hypothetical protein